MVALFLLDTTFFIYKKALKMDITIIFITVFSMIFLISLYLREFGVMLLVDIVQSYFFCIFLEYFSYPWMKMHISKNYVCLIYLFSNIQKYHQKNIKNNFGSCGGVTVFYVFSYYLFFSIISSPCGATIYTYLSWPKLK